MKIFGDLPFDKFLKTDLYNSSQQKTRVTRKIVLVSSTDIKELSQLENSARERILEENRLREENENLQKEIEKVRSENAYLREKLSEMDKKVQEVIIGINKSEEINNLEENMSELRYLTKNFLNAVEPKKAEKIEKNEENENEKNVEKIIGKINEFYKEKLQIITELFCFKSESERTIEEPVKTLEIFELNIPYNEHIFEEIDKIHEKFVELGKIIVEKLYEINLDEKVGLFIEKANSLIGDLGTKIENNSENSEISLKITELSNALIEFKDTMSEYLSEKMHVNENSEKTLKRQENYLNSNNKLIDE